MLVSTLTTERGQEITLNNARPRVSKYRVAFSSGSPNILGDGLPVVVHIDDDLPMSITAL